MEDKVRASGITTHDHQCLTFFANGAKNVMKVKRSAVNVIPLLAMVKHVEIQYANMK